MIVTYIKNKGTHDIINMTSNKSDVFEYMGNGQAVPKDVVSLRFHSSVIEVDNNAFRDCKQLTDVVLNEGLQSIGEYE